jgi:hypothetical protein
MLAEYLPYVSARPQVRRAPAYHPAMRTDRAPTQELFQRMADSWEGRLSIVSWRPLAEAVLEADYLLSPPAHASTRARFRLSVVSLPGVPEVAALARVQRLGRTPLGRWYSDGPPVYVSPVPSAVLAVAMR